MWTDLQPRERTGVLLVGAAVAIAAGLLGGICGAAAHAASIVIYLFVDPPMFVRCLGDLEAAYGAGALCGAVAGIAWTTLYAKALLHLRRRSGDSPSIPLSAGNAVAHAFLAGLLFILLFLAWSLHRGSAIGPLVALVLVLSSALKWLLIGLVGGAALRLVIHRKAARD